MGRPSSKFAGNEGLVSLGNAIRKARKSAGLSQEALAADADIDRSYMGGIERGEHNLTIMNLCRISDAPQIKPCSLLLDADL